MICLTRRANEKCRFLGHQQHWQHWPVEKWSGWCQQLEKCSLTFCKYEFIFHNFTFLCFFWHKDQKNVFVLLMDPIQFSFYWLFHTWFIWSIWPKSAVFNIGQHPPLGKCSRQHQSVKKCSRGCQPVEKCSHQHQSVEKCSCGCQPVEKCSPQCCWCCTFYHILPEG